MKRIRLLTAVGKAASRSRSFNLWDNFKALALICILLASASLANAQLTVTASGLPNIGRGQIKFADFNNDGKLDALVVGQTTAYNVGTGTTFKLYTGNGDGTFTDATSSWFTTAPTGVACGTVAIADYDRDGDLDFCYSGWVSATNVITKLYRNTGGAFEDYTTTAFNSVTPAGAFFGEDRWVDIDKDGDLDLIIFGRSSGASMLLSFPTNTNTRGGVFKIYVNNGSGVLTEFVQTLNGLNYCNLNVADFDGDGDQDLIAVGSSGPGLTFEVNNGSGTFENTYTYNTTIKGIKYMGGSSSVVGDFNNDGKPDIFMSNLLNTYVASVALFTNATTALTNNTLLNNWTSFGTTLTGITALGTTNTSAVVANNMAMVSAADYNNDGYLDVAMHGLSAGTPAAALYTGAGTTAFTTAGLTLTGLHYGGETWADINNDSKPDLITWGYSDAATTTPATVIYLNGVSNTNTAPSAPTSITATPVGSIVNLSWTMGDNSDDHTPNAALSYNIKIGSTSGGVNIVSPSSSVVTSGAYSSTSCSIKNMPDGNYFWSVQSVDANNKVGAWATEGTFMIGTPTSTPTVQATMIALPGTSISQTNLTLNWTNGDGYRTIVFAKTGSNASDVPAPISNIVYTANAQLGLGTQIGTSSWYCVYNAACIPSTAGSVQVTGLTGNTPYQFMVISYNASGDNSIINYMTSTSTNNPNVVSSLDYTAPVTITSAITASTITTTTVAITPSQSGGTGIYPNSAFATVVFMKEGNNASEDVPLVTNTTYTGSLVFGSGNQIGSTGWYCVYNGNSSYKGSNAFNPFSTFTGLKYNTSYQVRACTYSGTTGLEKFSATASVVFTTLAAATSTFQTEGNWSTYSNWSAGIPGAATTTVTIASNCTKDDDLTIAPATRYTLNDGVTLTVNGNLNINSSTIEPGTFVDHNSTGGLTVTGTSTVQQYLAGAGDATPSGRFWYISSPVTGAVSGAISASGNNKLWSYAEETTSYTEITDDVTTLSVGKGYVARLGASANASFAGALNTGDKSFNITRTGETNSFRGFNLIGNPYASYVTFSAADNASIEPTTWFRTQLSTLAGMAFDTYNIGTGEYVSGSGNGAVTGFIPPMQAFWVKTHTVGTTSVVFKQANRSHQTGAKLRSAEADTTPRIRLQITNGKCKDQTLIGLYTNASDAFDKFDSHKMTNNVDSFPEIFTMNGNEELAINGLKHDGRTKTLALGFRTGRKGDFKLKVLEMKNLGDSVRVILKDKIKNCEKELKDSSEYDFTSDVATTTDRFTIVITANAPTSLKDVTTASADAFSTNDNQIQVRLIGTADNNAKITVYSTLGQQMGSFATSSANTVIGKRFAPGIYMVNVEANGVQVTKKVVIN